MDSHGEPDSKKRKKKEARKKLKLLLPKRVEGEVGGKLQSTLDGWLFKKPRTRLRFNEHVLFKEITPDSVSWTTVPIKGFSQPWSAFSIQRQEVKSRMKSNHYKRRQRLPKNARKTTHILETMLRENTLLGY